MARAKGKKQPKTLIRTISLVVIALFIIIVVIGVFKEIDSGRKALPPTQIQVATARALVASALQSQGDSLSHYQIVIGKKIKINGQGENATETLQLCLSNNSTRHVYLVNPGANTIVLHSLLEFIHVSSSVHHYGDYSIDDLSCET